MTPLQLVDRARSQAEVHVDRTVSVHGPELSARLESGPPMLISELLAHPDQRKELRRFRYGHLLGPSLTPQEIEAWRSRHPRVPLHDDVVGLLLVADGIHLWADLDSGRAYFGILPLAEWCGVGDHVAASVFEEVPARALVISYHDNGDYFLLMDPAESRFIWFDPQSPEDAVVIATTIEDLLAWWWTQAEELDPRRP